MLNKLCLGTVQFGLNYGVKNELGRKPQKKESFEVLNVAIEDGITSFDTASVYGNAEQLLGEFGIGNYRVEVITKLRPNIMGNVAENIEKEIKHSLQRLKLDYLNGYLLHDAKDFYRKEIIKGLQMCKKQGFVRNIGVSIYEPEDALNVVRSRAVDYIQIPYNVFDQRLDETDFFELANKNNVKVFARSAFLQGLLLMDIERLPSCLIEAKPYLQKFNKIIDDYGYSKNDAAFLFSYCHEGIDRVVFGVETKEQLKKNIEIISNFSNFKTCYQKLHRRFVGIKEKIIVPSLWKI